MSIRTVTQEDPIGLAGGLNLYGFAGGDPINFSDPFGLCPQWVTGRPCVMPIAGASELTAANGGPPSGRRGSEYGWTRFAGGGRDFHSGLDAAASGGTELRAPADATASVHKFGEGGLVVNMNLGNGYSASFHHLSDVPDIFKDGDGNIQFGAAVQVGAGDVVGISGETGNAQGANRDPHVHIQTKENGRLFNPRAFYSNRENQ